MKASALLATLLTALFLTACGEKAAETPMEVAPAAEAAPAAEMPAAAAPRFIEWTREPSGPSHGRRQWQCLARHGDGEDRNPGVRSEERRVGKECCR